jgi:general secretion pathway protein D
VKDLIALIVTATLLGAQQPAPQQTAAQQPEEPALVLNLPNANLAEVIDILARQLKLNYILDPRVKGTITVHTYGEIRSADVRGLLETILRVNGFSLVQVGDLWRIVPAADVNRLPVRPRTAGAADIPDDEQVILNLVFLKFANAAEISKLVEQFLGEGAKMTVYEPANLILLLDNGRNMRRSLELISMFDSEALAGQRVRLYETKNSRPSDLARELERVIGTLGMAQKNAAVQFLPIDRINTLVALAPNPGAFDEVGRWIDKLDVEAKPPVGGTENFVFRVKYGRAEQLSMAVTLLYLSQQLSPTDTFAYMYLMNLMNQMSVQQTANAGAVPGQVGASPLMGGGMGMGGGGLMGLLPLLQGGGGMANMPGMMGMQGVPGMQGMMGQIQQPAAGVMPGQARPGDLTGRYLGAGGGEGGGMTSTPLKIPRVIPNPFDNTLLIQATQQEYQQILKLLEQIDVPPRQVLIEAKIYEVTLSDSFSSGVQAYLQKVGANPPNGTNPGRQLLGSFTQLGVDLSFGWLVSQSRELLVFLEALQDVRRTKIISAPTLIATDNIPASINVGTEVPIQVGSSIGIGGSQTLIQNRNAGVTLTITARVQSSGIVTMVLDQEVSQPIAPQAGAAIQSPSFSRRNVQTQVTVRDSDTIAIGGIIQESDLNSNAGVPGLVKIPVLGALFGGKTVNRSRTELIVFLTPRVVYDAPELIDASEELKQRFRSLSRVLRRGN